MNIDDKQLANELIKLLDVVKRQLDESPESVVYCDMCDAYDNARQVLEQWESQQ